MGSMVVEESEAAVEEKEQEKDRNERTSKEGEEAVLHMPPTWYPETS